jgi:Metallo-beta-lactamase superfamily
VESFAQPLDVPAADTLEVSVFGRGVGECIVAHVGDGAWIVVDSHMVDDPREPVALCYLNAIGVAPKAVRVVAATHWDVDHIRGLASVAEACPNARLVVSAALQSHDFFRQLSFAVRQEGPLGVGAKEFRALLDLAEARDGAITWANETTHIDVGHGTLRALAPSDRTQTIAWRSLATDNAAALPVNVVPNETSLVFWFENPKEHFLLGGDLEASGWETIVDTFSPATAASVYKVAHHGSPDADHRRIWTELLGQGPDSVVTPYKSTRPAPADVSRLRACSTAHRAGPARRGRIRRRDSHVERVARAANVERREGQLGHVRLRSAGPPWDVTYGGSAGLLAVDSA